MKSKKKFLTVLLLIIALVVAIIVIPRKGAQNFKNKYENAGNLNADVKGISRDNTYSKYLEAHSGGEYPGQDISVDITKYSSGEGVEVLPEYEGVQNVVSTTETSNIEWSINVPQAGIYQVYMEYYPVKSRGVDVERKFYINGEIPFIGSDALSFTRLWTNKTEVKRDNQGNDIRPAQTDVPTWTGDYFKDDLGYFTEPYRYYFEKGTNTIKLEAVNEPVIIKSLTLRAVKERASYADYRKSTPEVSASKTATDYIQVVQGENALYKSSPSLYALYDRSSPATVPYSVSEIRLNMIGGASWKIPGQWIEIPFEVPEDGYYGLTIKGRQNYNRGFVCNRSVYIDGVIPFKELESIGFKYSNKWESFTLKDKENNPFQFYLTKGKHTIRLEVTLGKMGGILNDMQDSVYRLNQMYRKILILTGANPDKYRDYRIAQIYPEVIEAMDLESKRLYKLVDEIVAYTGEKSSEAAPLQTLAQQLEKFVKNPDSIPKGFGGFKINISAVGTAIMKMSEAPMDLDYITVTGTNVKPKKIKETFTDRVAHESRSFATSFTKDYNAVGDIYKKDEAIQVWVLTGRDQSTIIKTMIDDTFTPNSNIKVNVKLVEASVLLNSIIAGKGPDVVISAGQGEPVNYALRNAVEDLAQFGDYQEVLKDFAPSAYIPFQFEGGLYALPETQNFNVMFYRKDILDELGVEVPQTWDDLIAILPTIQQNNMNVAIPSTDRTLNNVSNPDLSALFALLYQNGGTVYDQEGKKTVVDSEGGVKAFTRLTKLFNQYSLPTIYDFPNLFRSGEMPIGITDYSTFNTLAVFAPEIKGLWDFTLIPGTLREDGTIDRSCHSNGLATFMTKQHSEEKKKKAWTFMKWWVSAETQVRFGQEMECVMGASARYATANTKAFEQLSWSKSQMAVLSEQRKWAVGLREVAGGYYTGRHLTNAIRTVLTKKEDPRETLLDYATLINDEIEKKRLEFGLDSRRKKRE